ncbi:272_t:CDS:2, partial [Acaulospora colombiana]
IRPLFYRLSLSEMVVPYAETIAPHARKPGSFMSHSGEPVTINHAICIHEEDFVQEVALVQFVLVDWSSPWSLTWQTMNMLGITTLDKMVRGSH